ncbi:uncharacterized protein N7482_008166 [Penicillium canariense]|uniref:F-box domain-containing protein n=1 Tax=Penicillium canariense TaxID=189055 RepID=A0A9W9HT90_9EURO|nr:uncharacterized protein N7482_008166 [Penicillium canariense]KAJ5157066.1 hypothetical protein N7482_008166 [Penicillium canariense]
MSALNMIPEIWSLVFQFLATRNDLRNVCSVCRLFDAIATPFLYRSLIFRDEPINGRHWSKFPDDEDVKTQDEADDLSFGLLCRLLDDRNDMLRVFVREIIFEGELNDTRTVDRVWCKLQPPNDVLATLVNCLPNLEVIHFERKLPITDRFVNALLSHKKSPKLHLLGEDGTTRVNIKMPFVQKLHTSVDTQARAPIDHPETDRSGFHAWEPQRLALHELFNAFPNLEELSVSVNWLRGGCAMGGRPSPTRILGLDLSEDATFPPLKSLSLSGYPVQDDPVEDDEVALWRDRFPWDRLHSLSLGVQLPESTPGFLELATGKVANLKEFQITSYDPLSSSAELDAFLCSFDTLEILTAKGAVPSLTSVIHQSNLKHICLHTIEDPDRERETLDVEQIKDLSQHCPKLTTLEIDLDPNGTWPDDIVSVIATGFKNLCRLSIHVGLGIAHVKNDDSMEEKFARVLTESKAQDFAKRFFELRGPSVLEMITLKTGEKLRWFPQWHPRYADAEKHCAKIFEIYAPLEDNDEPRLNELESDYARWMRGLEEGYSGFRSLNSKNHSNADSKPQRLSRSPRVFKDPAFPLST